mmetsp:Transcript_112905/g.177654  ORF Transcript_112905/g.177654 Transcript_112905/m.177654 type:complete len:139 (+) Transcript_112905:38-454(+)
MSSMHTHFLAICFAALVAHALSFFDLDDEVSMLQLSVEHHVRRGKVAAQEPASAIDDDVSFMQTQVIAPVKRSKYSITADVSAGADIPDVVQHDKSLAIDDAFMLLQTSAEYISRPSVLPTNGVCRFDLDPPCNDDHA